VKEGTSRAWWRVASVLAATLLLPPANSGWAKSAHPGKPIHALGKQKKSDGLKHGERTANKAPHRA